MDGPITVSIAAIALANFVGHVVEHVGYHEAHHIYRDFLERWQDSPIDPATGLPRNHDLQEASLAALREAGLALAIELAGRLDPTKPWLPRLVDHVRTGKLFKVPLFETGNNPKRMWVERLREIINSERLAILHDKLLLSEDDVRRCFAGGDLSFAFGPRLAVHFLNWARSEIQEGEEPADFVIVTQHGWEAGTSSHPTITLAHAYCLFFREHLKRRPAVFNILVADTLNEIRSKISDLSDHPAPKLDLTEFERWLEPQLGGLGNLLGGVERQIAGLAQNQRQILVVITTLEVELRRGNTALRSELEYLLQFTKDVNAGMEILLDDAVRKDKRLDEILSAMVEMQSRITAHFTQVGAEQKVRPLISSSPFCHRVSRWFRAVIALHESGQLPESNLQRVIKFLLGLPLNSAAKLLPQDAVREALWREREEAGWFAKKSLFGASAAELEQVRIGEDCPIDVQQVRTAVRYGWNIVLEESRVRFVLVPPGTVVRDGKSQVNTSSFFLAETLLSQRQWAQLMPHYALSDPMDDIAMCGLSVKQVEEFVSRYCSSMELPTIAQLRFAALWSVVGFAQKRALLRQQPPSALGLYDMVGVAWQFSRRDTQQQLQVFGGAHNWERPFTKLERPAPDSATFSDPTNSFRPVLRTPAI